jgi:GTP-binding protein
MEPIEEVIIDVDDEYSSTVIDSMNKRKASMIDMTNISGKTRLIFKCPSRSLIGYQSQFLTETRGTGVINRLFDSYSEYKGDIASRRNGVLIANSTGTSVAYAIFNLQDRGIMFIDPQTKVYQGMIVGEHNRPNDLEINILKGKQLTNVRASGTDEAVKLVPPRKMSLEQMMAYIDEDEVLEVTPISSEIKEKIFRSTRKKKSCKIIVSKYFLIFALNLLENPCQ